jgi:hypothetical protein
MRKELEQKFATRWPEWFRDLYGDITQTCLHFGFEHRDGWFDLVWRMCEEIEKVPNKGQTFKMAQIKQKWGGLCVHFKNAGDAFHAVYVPIVAAEKAPFQICEVCGQPGYLIGYNRTICDEHFHCGSSPEWDERYRKTMTEAEWASAVTARRRLELMPSELVTHTCGHDRTYTRPTAEALKFVAEYARTTLCWDCWLQARARGKR